MYKGQAVKVSGTDFKALDGKTFVVGTVVDDTSIELVGADTTGSTETLGATPKLTIYSADDVVKAYVWLQSQLIQKLQQLYQLQLSVIQVLQFQAQQLKRER